MESRCFSCGAVVPEVEGPVHRYMASSPGCWASYGVILAREYSDAAYAANHRLTVDAYALQHPGKPSAQTIQSIGVHLTSLYMILERGMQIADAPQYLREVARRKSGFVWLAPPVDPGRLTVRDVLDCGSAREHVGLVREWALAVWNAWTAHHAQVKLWAEFTHDAS